MRISGEKIGNHYAVVLFGIALLCAAADTILSGRSPAETLLAWILLINIGFQGLLAGFMHWYGPASEKIAEKIGWPKNNPFQKEVAAADAAFGILGVLAFFIRDNFLIATVMGSSIMLFLMGSGMSSTSATTKTSLSIMPGRSSISTCSSRS